MKRAVLLCVAGDNAALKYIVMKVRLWYLDTLLQNNKLDTN